MLNKWDGAQVVCVHGEGKAESSQSFTLEGVQ